MVTYSLFGLPLLKGEGESMNVLMNFWIFIILFMILSSKNEEYATAERQVNYEAFLKDSDFKVEERILELKHKKLSHKILIDAPIITQFPELARGCEVTSLAMLLQFAGVKVDKLTLAEQIPKVPYFEDGFHGNPNDGFVGNIYSFNKSGYAVYHKPIEDLANSYLPGKIINLTGSDFQTIKEYLLTGTPVWVIVTSTFNRLPEEAWQTWNTKSGQVKITMREHSVLLTGFDHDYIYFNDPFKTEKNSKVAIEKFEAGWKQIGSQAITLKEPMKIESIIP